MRYFLPALLLVATPAAALPPRLPPVDRCASAPGFATFRARLQAAIARRDAAFLLSIASDDISFSFGDDPGKAGFVRAWDLAHPARSRLWRVLGETLRLGCGHADDGTLWSPAMALVEGDDEDAGIGRAVAVGPGAVLRAAPSDRGRIVSPLSFDVLTLPAGDAGEGAWVRVATADGRRGWVRRASIRGFGDYRAVFERRGGRWRMIAFVAGD
jgi:hypothetical protein